MADHPEKSEAAKREEKILEFWERERIFEKSLAKKSPKGEYVFYDGPPFATGTPHYGHIVASVIKDVVPRYWTMRGFHVPRIWGWDCHGLPIENIVEKELGFKHKKDIKEYGVANFNERCRERVLTYVDYWKMFIPRIGRWADMKNAYRTMDKSFMESVWWVFKTIYDKGLVYEDYRVMHICPRCETTLSQQEVSEGYKDVKDIAVTVKFKVKNPEKLGLSGDVYLLAWTTTPWTLPGNVALAVSNKKEDTYISFTVKESNVSEFVKGESYVLLGDFMKRKMLVGFAYGEGQGNARIRPVMGGWNSIIGHVSTDNYFEFSGSFLENIEYEPLFDYYTKDTSLKNRENGWKVYAADFVTTDTGTGIAHEAPAFGGDDWELSKKYNLPFVQHVNYDGTMKGEVTVFAGMEVKPRSDDDSVRLGTDIAVLKYLQEHGMLFAKENITHSYPHCWRCDTPLLNYATSSWFVSVTKIKENMLENAKSISWSPTHIKEGRWGKWLEGARDWSISRQRFWASAIPMWRCDSCKKVRVFGGAAELEEASGKQIDDLHKHIVDEITVPCACGGVMHRIPDVLDTWFDSGSMPYGERHYPFENKEHFDAVFPAQFIAEGVDQTRAWFYYLHVLASALFEKNAFQNVIVNGIVLAEDGKKMSKRLQNYPDPMAVVEKYGADALRCYLLSSPVVQAENLAFSESGVDEVAKKNVGRLSNVLSFYNLFRDDRPGTATSTHVLDRWILARLNKFINESTEGYEHYQLDNVSRAMTPFIDDLSTWYLRRSRQRIKAEGEDASAARAILRYVLKELAKIVAPVMPFVAEEVFLAVREEADPESVHLCDWPASSWIDEDLIFAMEHARSIASQALERRLNKGIRIKQPLALLKINHHLPGSIPDAHMLEEVIRDEVNVKEIQWSANIPFTVELDTALTPELIKEGDEREMASAIAQARKSENLSPKDVVEVVQGEGLHSVELSTGIVHFKLVPKA